MSKIHPTILYPTTLKITSDKHFYDSTYKKEFEDEISIRIDRK